MSATDDILNVAIPLVVVGSVVKTFADTKHKPLKDNKSKPLKDNRHNGFRKV